MNYIIMLFVPCNFLDSARVVFHDMEVAWQWSFTIVAAIGSCCLVEEFIILQLGKLLLLSEDIRFLSCFAQM